MLKTSAQNFKQNHTIHYRANIGQIKGIPVEVSGQDQKLFDGMYVIDTNHNNKPDLYTKETFNRLKLRAEEPVLLTSWSSIESLAKKSETEIIRQEDVRSVRVGQPEYDMAKFIWSGSHKSEMKNKRELDSVIGELGAFPRSAQWAIDVANSQFLIFSEKAAQA